MSTIINREERNVLILTASAFAFIAVAFIIHFIR